MSTDILGVVLALIVSLSTAAVGLVTAIKRAPAENIATLTMRIGTLEERDKAKDDRIDILASWQVAARLYILTLRNALADRGIQSPPPPPELGIAHREDET